MLKLLKLSAALSAAAVIVSLPQAVLSRPSSEASGSPAVQNSGNGSPFCYMRTQQGATLNLENLCRADDGSGSGNRATNAAPNPGATTPSANTTRDRRTFTFTGSPSRDVAPNRTNTGANTNANGANNNANPNANGANTGTNANGANNNANTNANGANNNTGTNANGANNNANTNANRANTGANTNANGANNNANTNASGTNTGANTNASGANNNANTNASGTNTGTNNQR